MVNLYKLSRIGMMVVGLAAIGGDGLARGALAQAPTPGPQVASMWDFFRREAEDRRAGGNGGPRVPGHCAITVADHQLVWNRNPAFVWTGLPTIALRQPAQAPFWEETVAAPAPDGVHRVSYLEKPLAPGSYELVFSSPLLAEGMAIPFEVIDDATHGQIAAELTTLEASLAAENADLETRALARASFFAEKKLAADALQALFAVAEPSPAMEQRQAEAVETFCAPEQPEPVAQPAATNRGLPTESAPTPKTWERSHILGKLS
ncbi:hypothetical protein PGN35_008705 [Nodosilinea sp. PGN35]|uniref:hypothetical protein n=1 Tax=Nodosilinea sp. PGN35 TaxID=3020489 RepID=UPI0023B2322C|nr:hypothetical protein [Nodosilinea sp. TSF1-S3]MDF0367940.1 hypothetical protein [Nodosilinea sp. TSF1-S3]